MFLNIQNLITMNVYNNLFLCKVMGMFCHKNFFDDRKQCSYEVKRDSCLEFRHCMYSRSPVPSQSALMLRASLRSCSHGHRWAIVRFSFANPVGLRFKLFIEWETLALNYHRTIPQSALRDTRTEFSLIFKFPY